ncbi:MAG: hypothetical protein A2700_01060 [Candidatus Blackburnbacteria bacterium RIFCSPHIGHO2_01_FULL_44_64]|uniref:Carrier domain-containing protein n=1 Tax=Candidatus Blackburnbacteria bacterium RIFCSPHIGHO2_02_FULL_44_20 TaxID=1797516 RepID=A0A1G1V5I4_9BACT|nr:MAG: hypothetical protein A2700_01060 [Candidatus Blackburnbacteria bacterium RIFCSPHIGHO2_01_FULL_44_64]OGY10665.1 MAG: hypothetical protein A3D26_00695 [Candidatus Blackburnbacteria bacterium RIFCSPHIGHO2_02_FULL_44_20]OGY11058.1 MAG: hypothetical protein A3E16_04610 [Candidatus Blackburnbacteria bacterium RIFCSPHIGHO2_12_FULL_44_25]OGY13443.1 MAG: hypothetical protein A3A62_02980 [Candidatus Blackburnbacteria bacterium RIFCSPLOWO2_01_FULL_44_43]OGY16622.1 MAG: hypothetical protein A3H88_0
MDKWTTDDIRKKVLSAVAKYTKNQEAWNNATDNTRFVGDMGINSASLIDIVLELEDTFGFDIDDQEVKRIVTVGTAVAVLEQKLTAAGRMASA